MAKRAERLFYLGGITRSPKDHFRHVGVPPRDLDTADIARLSDDAYAQITGAPPFATGSPYSGPLYAETKPRAGSDGDDTKRDDPKAAGTVAKAD